MGRVPSVRQWQHVTCHSHRCDPLAFSCAWHPCTDQTAPRESGSREPDPTDPTKQGLTQGKGLNFFSDQVLKYSTPNYSKGLEGIYLLKKKKKNTFPTSYFIIKMHAKAACTSLTSLPPGQHILQANDTKWVRFGIIHNSNTHFIPMTNTTSLSLLKASTSKS